MNLGINGLEMPQDMIHSAVYNHKGSIKDAAHDVLSDFVRRFESKMDAYKYLMRGLHKCKMNQLAAEVRQWVEGGWDSQQISDESKYISYKYLRHGQQGRSKLN